MNFEDDTSYYSSLITGFCNCFGILLPQAPKSGLLHTVQLELGDNSPNSPLSLQVWRCVGSDSMYTLMMTEKLNPVTPGVNTVSNRGVVLLQAV